MKAENFTADLNSSDKKVIFDVTERIINLFDSYAKIDVYEFMMLMNSIVLKCASPEIQEDREAFGHLFEALEKGTGKNGTDLVNFEPLMGVFHNIQCSDFYDRLLVILLNSSDKEVLFDVTEIIINTFDSYAKIEAHENAMLMNSIILKCASPEIQEDRETFEHLLEALEMGVGRRDGTDLVNFEPLIEVFSNGQFSDIFFILVIILGASHQPKYIDYLSAIETDDSSLKKEIDDAVFELKYSKY